MKEVQYTVTHYITQVQMEEYRTACVDVPKFLSYCQRCSNYNKVWSCPAFDFSAEQLWSQYRTMELYGREVRFSPEALELEWPPEELGWKSKEILRPVQQELLQFLLEREKQIPGSMALAAGSCEGCFPEPCRKQKGLPCIHPERMRYSLEALGGDVSLTASRYLHKEMVWGKRGHLPEYYFLVGALLKK